MFDKTKMGLKIFVVLLIFRKNLFIGHSRDIHHFTDAIFMQMLQECGGPCPLAGLTGTGLMSKNIRPQRLWRLRGERDLIRLRDAALVGLNIRAG